MGPTHVRQHGPPGLHTRIGTMLDFPTLDSASKSLADRKRDRLFEITEALGIGAGDLRFMLPKVRE